MIVPVMAISNLVLTQQIYSEETNGAHAHYREPVPLNLCCKNGTILPTVWLPTKTGPPKVTKISGSSQIVVRDDSYVKFQCKVVSNLAANVTWLLNGLPLTGQMKHNHFVVGWNADSGILAKSGWYHSQHPQHLT